MRQARKDHAQVAQVAGLVPVQGDAPWNHEAVPRVQADVETLALQHQGAGLDNAQFDPWKVLDHPPRPGTLQHPHSVALLGFVPMQGTAMGQGVVDPGQVVAGQAPGAGRVAVMQHRGHEIRLWA
ncbi:MAG TPA: hypothetical protein DCE36_06705 [Pseudomonas sp.]|nr:hypothetical protein [Pseudomonas sp.]